MEENYITVALRVVCLLWLVQAIWHWMESYPEEFTELQKRPNDDLAGLYHNNYFCYMTPV